ncbi:MAG TPA: hypothetical protein VGJ09_06965, partial [Bryobacteraceae bacterium]
MRSISVGQAALFAACGMLALTAFYLFDNAGDFETWILVLGAVPSLVWAGFFLSIYFSLDREQNSARWTAWVTLVFAIFLEIALAYVRAERSIAYWTPFGNLTSLSGWLLRIGWAVWLIAFARAANHAIAGAIAGKVALVVAILSAPPMVSAAYDLFNGCIGILLSDVPPQAFWRALITPAIRMIYWSSQVLFL